MLKYGRLTAWAVLTFLIASLPARTFKVATITPDNSPWTKTLRQFAQDIAQQTEGRVRFKIYAGGVAGGEADVLRKMKIGQIDGAVLSALGASLVAPSSLVMSLPFLIENTEQLNRIIDEANDLFNHQGAERGYEILGWSFSGWIHLFSKKKIKTLEDLSNVNIAISSNQREMIEGWQALKATPRSLAFLDTPTALQNGLVDTFYNTPTGAVAFQLFALAKNMSEVPLAPLTGAVVFSSRKWKQITREDQQRMRDLLKQVMADFQRQSGELDQQATDIMLKNGLHIVPMDEAEKQRWRKAFSSRAYPSVVGEGKPVDSALYQKIKALIAAE